MNEQQNALTINCLIGHTFFPAAFDFANRCHGSQDNWHGSQQSWHGNQQWDQWQTKPAGSWKNGATNHSQNSNGFLPGNKWVCHSQSTLHCLLHLIRSEFLPKLFCVCVYLCVRVSVFILCLLPFSKKITLPFRPFAFHTQH